MKSIKYIICAVLAAALYALNAPFSKILLSGVEPRIMAAMLYLGAARTSAYYAVAPFIGAALSFAVLSESLTVTFGVGLAVMMVGTWFVTFGQKE